MTDSSGSSSTTELLLVFFSVIAPCQLIDLYFSTNQSSREEYIVRLVDIKDFLEKILRKSGRLEKIPFDCYLKKETLLL